MTDLHLVPSPAEDAPVEPDLRLAGAANFDPAKGIGLAMEYLNRKKADPNFADRRTVVESRDDSIGPTMPTAKKGSHLTLITGTGDNMETLSNEQQPTQPADSSQVEFDRDNGQTFYPLQDSGFDVNPAAPAESDVPIQNDSQEGKL